MTNNHDDTTNKYEDLDDAYDYAPTPRGRPVNHRMATLNRHAGALNRCRNMGLIA